MLFYLSKGELLQKPTPLWLLLSWQGSRIISHSNSVPIDDINSSQTWQETHTVIHPPWQFDIMLELQNNNHNLCFVDRGISAATDLWGWTSDMAPVWVKTGCTLCVWGAVKTSAAFLSCTGWHTSLEPFYMLFHPETQYRRSHFHVWQRWNIFIV